VYRFTQNNSDPPFKNLFEKSYTTILKYFLRQPLKDFQKKREMDGERKRARKREREREREGEAER